MLLKKSMRLSGAIVVLALVMSVLNWSTLAGTVKAEEAIQFGTVSVTGLGEIMVKPDVAYIQVGLETVGNTAKESHDANAKQFTELSKVLKDLKIADKDIKTTSFNTYPNYEWINNKQELKGYRTEQMIQVTYRDLDQIGTVLDQLTTAGANRVRGVQFDSEKIEQYKLEALDKAMENARSKAERLAKHAGSKIKGVISISEGGSYYQPMYDYNVNIGFSMAAKENAASTQIYSGEIKVQANVNVTYSY